MESTEQIKLTELNEHQKNITLKLLQRIKESPGLSIEYGGLAKKVDIGEKGALSLGKSLAKISTLCYQLHLPLISVIVYAKRKGNPSEGFESLYEHLTNKKIIFKEKFDKFIQDEKFRVAECPDWNILADYLGLDIDMSKPE